MAITGASLQPIYDRLHGADGYHPMSANTFADWSMEAGDIITMSRDGQEYASPVHSSHLSWRGSPVISINAEGKEERDSVARTSKRKYGSSGAGMRNDQAIYYDMYSEDGKLHTELEYSESRMRVEFEAGIDSTRSDFASALEFTAEHLELEFEAGIHSTRVDFASALEMTASHLEVEFLQGISSTRADFASALEMTASHLEVEFEQEITSTRSDFASALEMTASHLETEFVNNVDSLRSELELTASHFEVELTDTANSLRSDINVQAGRISLVVEGEGTSAAIKLDAIVDGINQSQLELNADRVVIGSGSSKKAVQVYIDGKITATDAEITNLLTGTTKATLINTSALVGDTVTGGTVYASNSLSIGSGTQGGSGTLYYRGSQFYRQGLTLGTNGSIAEGHFLGDSNTTMNIDHYHKIVAEEGTGEDAGKIIITLTDPVSTGDTSEHTTNFNIAATTTYINGVLAARKAVKVNPFTADARQQLNDHRTFTYKTDVSGAGQETWQTDTWYIAGGSTWSSNSTTVGLYYGSASGTKYAELAIAGPTPSNWQLAYQANTNYTYKAKCNVGGTLYESGNLSATNAYDNGWSGAYGTVGISPNSAQSLAPGGSVTVYAQAKSTSGAQSKTNVANITVTADAISTSDWQLNYQSNTSYTYKAKVKINGTFYESGNLNATNAYDNGWSGAYGTVGISPSSAQSLAPGGSVTVYAQAKATSGAASKTNVASVTVSANAISTSDWQLNYQSGTSYTYKAKVKINGTFYESGNLSATNAYDNGWSGAYGTVGISPSTAQTLSAGGSVTVYAQAKATSGAASKTNVASVTVTANADPHTVQANRTVTYTSNGSKTLNPSTGYNVMEKATITVSVPDPSITYSSSLSTSNTQYTGVDKTYNMNKSYTYGKFTVTCGSNSKVFQIKLLSS